jgi:hypothetical protein
MEKCKGFIRSFSASQRAKVLQYLLATYPSILVLGEDLLGLVSSFLEPHDRASFLEAIVCRSSPGVPRLTPRTFPTLTSLFCTEVASRDLYVALSMFAERILYVMPSFLPSKVVVSCNWSPFASGVIPVLATVHWSPVYPHVRVEYSDKAIRAAVAHNLQQLTPTVRLVAHCVIWRGGLVVHLQERNLRRRICIEPLLITEALLLREIQSRNRLLLITRPTSV